ncbi:hypothetical protein Ancab_008050 [Ancistrocladus abbreviatus]
MDLKSDSQTHIELVVDATIPTTKTSSIQPSTELGTSTIESPDHDQPKRLMWRIITNFHGGYFRICLSLSSQALLWKTLIQPTDDNHALRRMLSMFPSIALTLLWSLALVTLVLLSGLYTLKCFLQFDRIKAEFLHHVGVNYLFIPWMSWLLLLQSSPPVIPVNTIYSQLIWWVFVIPIIMLDIKIYGQWFTKGKRFLSRVANPTSQLSVVANLVGAKAAVYMGWKEIALCLFSTGMAHYLVIFVTLYQRLPGNNGIPMMLRPVFFLFIATPSMASLAWGSINGTFDNPSKMLFFLSLFLFISLLCRPKLFWKAMRKFSVAWWAYSFPLTLLAIASVEYAQAQAVKGGGAVAHALMLLLSLISVLVCFALMIFTVLNLNRLLLASTVTYNLNAMS